MRASASRTAQGTQGLFRMTHAKACWIERGVTLHVGVESTYTDDMQRCTLSTCKCIK